MKRLLILAVAFAAAGAWAAEESTTKSTRTEHTTTQTGSQSGTQSSSMIGRDPQTVISAWPSASKNAASMLIEKYGQPDAAMDRMLVWNDRAPYQKVAVLRDSQQVDFPSSHQVYIEHSVSYKVPADKVASLIQFDQALVIDLVRGTLSSYGDSEKTNVLALNLADEIATGKRTVASAKNFMRSAMDKETSGKSSGYADKLLFTPSGETNVPEHPSIKTDSTPAMPGSEQMGVNDEATPREAQP